MSADPYDWTVECPCGHSFSAAAQKQWRGAGGKYLNRDVEHSAIDARIEVQCPKCLLWVDAATNEVNGL